MYSVAMSCRCTLATDVSSYMHEDRNGIRAKVEGDTHGGKDAEEKKDKRSRERKD